MVAVAESVTVTPKVAVVGPDTALGVPVMTPVLLNCNPAGKFPLTRLQVNGAVPPLRVSVRVQTVPAVQACRLVLMAGAGLMVTPMLTLPVSLVGSVAVMVAIKVPAPIGVPESPVKDPVVGLTAIPGGSPDDVQV